MLHGWLLFALPISFAVFTWWGSTALIFYLNNLPRHSFRWSMLAATLVAAVSLHGLAISSRQNATGAAYLAFICALLAWGWLQMSFYMGFLAGPRSAPCHQGCGGWRHFGHAVRVGLYHDLAGLALGAAIMAITWHAPNQVGGWTFVILWAMHLSARLNVFLGVHNLNVEFLPPHLDFIRPFLTQKPMNLLFPASVSATLVVSVLVVQHALVANTPAPRIAADMFFATLLALAILEHWFLVLPLPAAESWNGLWRWTLRARNRRLKGLPKNWQPAMPCQANATNLASSLLPSTNWNRK